MSRTITTESSHRRSAPGVACRRLIVHADDFGLSDGVNAGVIEARRAGIVRSASLMVRWPAATAAVRDAETQPRLDLGLHLDLGEWEFRDGGWRALYEVVPLEDAGAVEAELRRQLARFRELVGRDPSHIDSHQHVHRREPVRSLALAAARELGVPLRDCTPGICYQSGFYGQTAQGEELPEAITAAALIGLLEGLAPGVSELSCHPGWDDSLATMYCRARRQEVSVLCCPEVVEAVRVLGIELISYAELGAVAWVAGGSK